MDQRERNGHGDDRKSGSGKRRSQHKEEFANNEVGAGNWTRQNSFHGAAFFFARGQVDRRMHASVEAEEDDDICDESAKEKCGARFFRRSYILLRHLERF